MTLKLEDPLGSAPVSDAEQHRANNRKLEAAQAALEASVTSASTAWRAAYPVGSIYLSTLSTNPATLLGFGTWAAFGAGRVLVGIDAGQVEFDTVEETGGAKTHTLSTAELAAHAHTHDQHNHGGTSTLQMDWKSNTAGAGAAVRLTDIGGITGDGGTSSANFAHGIPLQTTTEQNAGGGGAHNNLQPYIVAYFWKRTA